MKFNADKNLFHETIISASKACAGKSALSILDGILLTLTENKLVITGYDLDIGIKSTITVDGTEDGHCITDPKLLSEMVKKMPGDSIDFTLEEKTIKITSGKSKLNLPYKSGDEFPNIIEIKKETAFEMSEKVLRDLLVRVEFATSPLKPELECVHVNIKEDMLCSVASDSNRMAYNSCGGGHVAFGESAAAEVKFSMPMKAVYALVRELSAESDKKVSVSVDKKQICVSKENFVLISRLLEAEYFNYQRVLENEFTKVITVEVKELMSALERYLLITSEKFKIPTVLSVESTECGFMRLFCKTPTGELEDEIPITVVEGEFDKFELNFNPRFMLEALQRTGCDNVVIGLSQSLKPFKIVPPLSDESGLGFVYIIVPIRSM